MKRLLIATTNRNKALEIRQILAGVPFEIITLGDVEHGETPDESGSTFAENARAKAAYYAGISGELTVAEDSGLVIDALGGRPGVESARFGGAATPYPKRFALIETLLRQQPDAGRTARFVCALAVARGAHILFEAQGVIEGVIAAQAEGEGGFGYDPIFYVPSLGCTLAQAGAAKNDVSHRAQAFRALRASLVRTGATDW